MGMPFGNLHNFIEDDERGGISSVLIKGAYSSYLEPDGSFQNRTNSFRGREYILYLYNNLDDNQRNLRGNYFQYLEIGLIEGLKYRANFGVEFDYLRHTNFEPEFVGAGNSQVSSFLISALDYNWIHESYLSYDREFGDHSISALAGFSAQKWGRPEESISGNLANSLIPTLNNLDGLEGVDLANTFSNDQNDRSLASLFARVSYSYKDKYLASATVRRDGSSRFGPDNRWGTFPSVSVGWRFSEEPFLQGQSFLDDGKIRIGYAITGNERINNRDFDFLLDIGNFYNGQNGVGLSNQLGNTDIKWEETDQFNVGLDLGFINGRVNLTLDWYQKKTTDLLANRPLPPQTGFEETRVNLGEVENKGIEVGVLAIPVAARGFKWETNFNFTYNKNEVTSLAGDVAIITRDHRTEVGSPLGNFYGYQINGIYPSDAANTNGVTANGITLGAGDYIWQNTDGNGAINGDDRVILLEFLDKWAEDWKNAEFKCLLSQTIFANASTHHGGNRMFLYGDMDSGGWPKSGRDKAVKAIRKASAFHICGDQHLPSFAQYGLDDYRQAGWVFCTPAIAVGYQRSFLPEEVNIPIRNKPDHQLANTGEFTDIFGNPLYVYAVGNPEDKTSYPNRYRQAVSRSSGFGISSFDPVTGNIRNEAYRFDADLNKPLEQNMFPGWPVTINKLDNLGEDAKIQLPTIKVKGDKHPVVKIHDDRNELIYAVRTNGGDYAPKVRKPGKYKIVVGYSETDYWKEFEVSHENQEIIEFSE